MTWKTYALAMLRLQRRGHRRRLRAPARCRASLPLNPAGLAARHARSRVQHGRRASPRTRTGRRYGGESTLSYLTQMVGLDGAELRLGRDRHGGARRAHPRLRAQDDRRQSGSFWVDLVRSTLYVLLPLSFVLALVLVSQGVVQTFGAVSRTSTLLDRRPRTPTARPSPTRCSPLGPGRVADRHQAARHERRRLLQRRTRPTRSRTRRALSNFVEMLAILLIPAGALLHVRQDGRRHAAGLGGARRDVRHLRPAPRRLRRAGAGRQPGARVARRRPGGERAAAGGNMEGKEVRFGIANSALWATATTARLERLGQRDARLASRRSAGSCRCG